MDAIDEQGLRNPRGRLSFRCVTNHLPSALFPNHFKPHLTPGRFGLLRMPLPQLQKIESCPRRYFSPTGRLTNGVGRTKVREAEVKLLSKAPNFLLATHREEKSLTGVALRS